MTKTSTSQMTALIEMYQADHDGAMPSTTELMMMREAIASVTMSHDDEVSTVEITADSAFVAHPGEDDGG